MKQRIMRTSAIVIVGLFLASMLGTTLFPAFARAQDGDGYGEGGYREETASTVHIPWGVSAGDQITFHAGMVPNLTVPAAFHAEMGDWLKNLTNSPTAPNTQQILSDIFGLVPANESMRFTVTHLNASDVISLDNKMSCYWDDGLQQTVCSGCNRTQNYHRETVWASSEIWNASTSTWITPGQYSAGLLQQGVDVINTAFGAALIPQALIDPMIGNMTSVPYGETPLAEWWDNVTMYENCSGDWDGNNRTDAPEPPDIMISLEHPQVPLVVPTSADLTEFYDFGTQMYAWELANSNDTGSSAPRAAQDGGDGDNDDGDEDGGPWDVVDQPPTFQEALTMFGFRNFYVEPRALGVTFALDNMDTAFLDFLTNNSQNAGIQNMTGEGALAMEWNASGVLKYMVAYIDASAEVDTSTIVQQGAPRAAQDGPPAPPNLAGEMKFDLKVFAHQPGERLPTLEDIKRSNIGSNYVPSVTPTGNETTTTPPGGVQDVALDDLQVKTLATGTNKFNFTASDGTKISIEINTTGSCVVTTGYWPTNPVANSNPGFLGNETAVFFQIESSDDSKIQFPIKVTMNFNMSSLNLNTTGKTPAEINALAAAAIGVRTYTGSGWKPEEFPVVVDYQAGTVTITVTHLSVFALGVSDTAYQYLDIPGFSTGLMLVAMLGAVAVLVKKKRR